MNDQVHANPVTIESDDCGTRLMIDLAGMEGEFPLLRIGCTLSTSAAIELYEHVDRALGEWAREGIAMRRSVAAGEPPPGCEWVDVDGERLPLTHAEADDWLERDPGERLREAGDHLRKARRENG